MRFGWLICLYILSSPASAGLFADDDARKQIQQLESRIAKLESSLTAAEESKEQLIRALLDLQMQLEAQATELRKLRGQDEEQAHQALDAEKRQKDFYVDLDARLRRLESNGGATPPPVVRGDGRKDVAADPLGENKAFEAAYTFYKNEKLPNAVAAFNEFLSNYPGSVHEPNVQYWLGNAHYLLRDCPNSLRGYQTLIEKFPDHPRVPEAMFNIADCQLELKGKTSAKKTLKQIISQFPGSGAAEKAKKRLATIK